MGKYVKNGLLLLVVSALSLLLSEVIVRQFFHPVDFLLPITIDDDKLGHRVVPGTGGHDKWGFRNYSIEQETEIIAIGDSQTYGVSATFQESWPAHLSRLTNTKVYNLALGGYGPLQYLQLLKSRAMEMSPKVVIIGLFLGNDLMDSFRLTYSNDAWNTYKNSSYEEIQSEKTEVTSNWKERRFLNGIRNWLAQHSVLYRLITQTIIGDLVRKNEFRSKAPNVIELEYMRDNHLFIADAQFSALDRTSQQVQEGIRISKMAMREIKQVCQDNEIRLLVALIPTKELVFSDLFENQYQAKLPDSLMRLFDNEQEIRQDFIRLFEDEEIEYVDTLPALKLALTLGKDIYPVNDGHTNGNGYKIIAEEIEKALKLKEPGNHLQD